MNGGEYTNYLTWNKADELWQVICADAGTQSTGPGQSYPPDKLHHPPAYSSNWDKGRVLGEYQLIYIAEGAGNLQVGQKKYTLQAGNAFLLFPGIRHWYSPDKETGWREYYIGFRGQLPEKLQQNRVIAPENPVYFPGRQQQLLHDFNRVLEVARTRPPGYQPLLGSLAMTILTLVISSHNRREQGDEREQIVEKARFHFEEHLYEPLDIQQSADSIGCSYSVLLETFKAYTGLTPYQYFLNLKISKAKELLATTSLSVKEVSHTLSFDNQYYFSRLFKQKTGKSPSNWSVGAPEVSSTGQD